MALPNESSKTTPPVPVRLSDLSDSKFLESFKQNPTSIARKLIGQPKQLDRFWRLLEYNSPRDQGLINSYDKVQNILGKIPPPPRTQPDTSRVLETPPTVTAEQIIQPEVKGAPRNKIGPDNAQRLENYLNNFKSGFHDYMAGKKFEAANYQNLYSRSFLEYLALYRGGLADFYLTQGAHEMLFSALGPIGDLLRKARSKNIQWQMAWMKNPLNANAVYYYLNSLPTETAFKIAMLPVQKTFAILAQGGAPLFTKATYQELDQRSKDYGQIKQKYFFSPTLQFSRTSSIAADGLDKLSGIPTDRSGEDQYFENINREFGRVLNTLKQAKTNTEKQASRNKIKTLLNQHDGRLFQDIFRPHLKNLSRRLRRVAEDPISGVFTLLAGTLVDAIIGTVVSLGRVIVNRVINSIPGLNTLRAQLTEFFTSNRYLNTMNIGGASIKSFGQGLFSPTTLSSGYLGYKLGNILFPGSPVAIAWSTGITGGVGAFYNIALKMTNSPIPSWVGKYQTFKGASISGPGVGEVWGEQMIKENFLKGFKPGPLSNLSRWLYDHPYARLPINGFVVGDILSPIIETQYGINPWFTRLAFSAADWTWQTKGVWGDTLAKTMSRVFTQPTWNIFGREFINHFSLQNPNAWAFKIRGLFSQAFYAGDPYSNALLERPWFNSLKSIWSKAQPYATNVFNPGFFMGFGLAPLLSPSLGAWAYVVGPVAGSAAWMMGTRALSAVTGIPYGQFVARFNPLAFTGFFVSQLTGLALFGSSIPFLYTAAWTFGFPIIGMGLQIIASTAGLSVAQLLSSIIGGLSNGLIIISSGTIAAGIAAWATVISVTALVGLSAFFIFTIYAGFWVPFVEESNAGPQSSNFTIKTEIEPIGPNKYRICSNFSISNNVFNSDRYLIDQIDFRSHNATYLTVNLTDPETTTDAFRGQALGFVSFSPETLTPSDYTIPLPNITSPDEPPLVGWGQLEQVLEVFLSTPTDQQQNLLELMQQNPAAVSGMKPFFDILKQLAQEVNSTHRLVAEYQAQLSLIKKQNQLVDGLINSLSSGNLTQAQSLANSYLNQNPLNNPCPDPNNCPEERRGLKQLYDSWSNLVNGYLVAITGFLNQSTPQLDTYIASLETTSEGLKEQIQLLPELIDQIEKIQSDMTTADAQIISTTNFFSFSNMDLIEQEAVWGLLAEYFPKVFDKNNYFFFIPQGTNYRVCVDADYCYALDPANPPTCPTGQPITVCSTISYKPNYWSPNTSFAKSCASFTPQ